MTKKVVLIGNGFDLAHGLKTGYGDFAKAVNKEKCIKKYRRILAKIYKKPIPVELWSDFETQIEEIAKHMWSQNFTSFLSRFRYKRIEKNMNKYNDMFNEISKLLKQYLKNVTNGKKIERLSSIEDEFDSDTYAISFNYTDSIKLYTSNYEYVHGSLNEDDFIILGFAKNEMPCIAGGEYIEYGKSYQKEILDFMRCIKGVESEDKKRLVESLKKHARTLYSGKGGYDFPLIVDEQGNEVEDMEGEFDEIIEYAKRNNFMSREEIFDFDNVEEIVIAGHGLECDRDYISNVFASSGKLKIVKIFSHDKETEEAYHKKVTIVKDMLNGKKVEIRKLRY